MKIWTTGARFFGGQIDRIDSGFLQLGHEIVSRIEDADLIYCNNPWYDEVIELEKSDFRGKKIFTVLDLAPHLGGEFDVAKLTEQLKHADAICTISETVQQDLLGRTGKRSTVIYQPIKDVKKANHVSNTRFKALFVGRVNDLNKRSYLAAEALHSLGFLSTDIVTVGSDRPYYGGCWTNVVNDNTLEMLYNSTDFVMCCSQHEGIGLPAIEAMACGAIPVICNDLSTRHDFFRNISEYDDVNPDPASIAKFMKQFLDDPGKMETFKQKLHQHYLDNWKDKMSGVGVAQAILNVYNSI